MVKPGDYVRIDDYHTGVVAFVIDPAIRDKGSKANLIAYVNVSPHELPHPRAVFVQGVFPLLGNAWNEHYLNPIWARTLTVLDKPDWLKERVAAAIRLLIDPTFIEDQGAAAIANYWDAFRCVTDAD